MQNDQREAVARLTSIKRSGSYVDSILDAYGHAPRGKFFDDLDAILALLSARPFALGGQKGDSETLRVLLDNLVIAQTLSKDIRQKATDEARSYLYDLRHTPQPSGEARELAAYFGTYRHHVADGAAVTVYVPLTLQQIDAAIESLTTPARAEAQDEGAAGEPVALAECPPGLFLWNGTLGFKSEYGAMEPIGSNFKTWKVGSRADAYCADSGEYFWGGTSNHADRDKVLVMPIDAVSAHPSPTPAADADRVRIAVEALEYYAGPHAMPNDGPCGTSSDDYGRRAAEAIAALKLGHGK